MKLMMILLLMLLMIEPALANLTIGMSGVIGSGDYHGMRYTVINATNGTIDGVVYNRLVMNLTQPDYTIETEYLPYERFDYSAWPENRTLYNEYPIERYIILMNLSSGTEFDCPIYPFSIIGALLLVVLILLQPRQKEHPVWPNNIKTGDVEHEDRA